MGNLSTFLKRKVFNYKYIKRNIIIGVVVLLWIAGIAFATVVGLDDDNDVIAADSYVINIEDTAKITIDSNSIAKLSDVLSCASVENTALPVVTEGSDAGDFTNKIIVKVEGNLNVRSEANTESIIVGTMNNGAVGDVIGSEGEWTQISSDGVTGYVKTEYTLTGAEANTYAADYKKSIGTVTGDSVRVRKAGSTDSDILVELINGSKVVVMEDGDTWVSVMVTPTLYGYISKDYITVEEGYEMAMSADQSLAIDESYAYQEELRNAANTASNSQNSNTGKTNTSGSQATSTPNTTVTPTQNAPISTSYDDSYLLACLVSMEAGNEPYEGQLAVANVVLNRLRSGRWGSSISSVIYANGQFPSVNGSVMNGYLANGPVASAQQAANEALAGNNNIGSYMCFNNVRYGTGYSDCVVIGNHCFH